MSEGNTIKTFVVEDEPDARELMLRFLELHCPEIEVIGTAQSVEEAETALKTISPELVFLDVELGGQTSFQLLALLPDRTFHTIFVTAHQKYMLKALRAHALDFLLKPIDLDDLLQAVARVKTHLAQGRKNSSADASEILNQLHARRVAVPTRSGQQFVQSDEIIYAKADGSYVELHLTDQDRPLVISRKMKEVETVLTDLGFMRVSRSHLVNLDHVLEYLRVDGGVLVLSNRSEIPVSKSNRNQLTEALKARSASL